MKPRKISNSRYAVINISNNVLNGTNFDHSSMYDGTSGYVYVPYIPVNIFTIESDDEKWERKIEERNKKIKKLDQ